MRLKHINKMGGFTIIELLIVIIVLGILATIVIVAYTGVTNRAEDAKRIATIDQYEKALHLYYTEHDNFPYYDNSDNPYVLYACLGTVKDYPATDKLAAGQCLGGGDAAYSAYVDEGVNSALKEVIPSLPSGAYKTYELPKGSAGEVYGSARGIMYTDNRTGSPHHTDGTPDTATLLYIDSVQNSHTCGRGIWQNSEEFGFSACYLEIKY